VTTCLVASLGLLSWACHSGSRRNPDSGEQPLLVGPESTVLAELRSVSTGPRISGSLEAKERATIAAEASGSVLELGAELGDAVKRGQVLAQIEAQASQEAVHSARSAVESAQQAVDLAQRQAKRSADLVARGAQATAKLEVDRNAVSLAQAQLQETRARLTLAGKGLQNATARAPLDGLISEQLVHKGDIVSTGTRLFTIIDPSSMRLQASVPSDQLPQLTIDAAVQFEIRGRPGETFTGAITRIAPAADPATRQIPILVSIPNPSRRLLAGLFAQGRVSSQTSTGVVLPSDAVEVVGSRATVTVIREGVAHVVPVTLGLRDESEDRVLIASGVAAGEQVLRGAARAVAPGTRVKLLSAPAAPTGAGRAAQPAAPGAPPIARPKA
jgi:RND family efflux transporter MFP subunit